MMAVALQFYSKDRDRAMRLAHWITDIEKSPRSDVMIILVNRFDCAKADEETVRKVSSKFPVMTFTTTTKQYGWPEGCNAVAFDVFRMIEDEVDINVYQPGDPLLLIEPDCVPISRTWLNDLTEEWQLAQAQQKCVMGAWRKSGPECGHINGNAIFDVDITRKLPGLSDAMKAVRGTAWDAALAPYFKGYWYFTGLISNRWNENTLTDEQIETPWIGCRVPVLIHGCKSEDVWKYAQRKLFPPP